jgi:hypothetical protein
MEHKTVWSVICHSAAVLPTSFGWKRKTSDSRLAKKAFKDIYKLNKLVNCHLNDSLVNLMDIVHVGAFEQFCSECFINIPNCQLTRTLNLLHTLELSKTPFSERELKDKNYHWQAYRGAQWAKNTTVGQLIEKITDQVCRYNICSKHTAVFKKKNSMMRCKKYFSTV